MTDRPMIFSAPMVRALLAGRKTQTRRVVRFPKWAHTVEVQTDEHGRHPDVICDDTGCFATLPLPFAVGDRLWVREAHAFVGGGDPGLCVTRADFPDCVPFGYENIPSADEVRWRPSIHMPRRASRLTLLVTDVRVQRLQEISEDDALAEGCFRGKATKRVFESMTAMRLCGDEWRNCRDWFADVWERLYGAEAWAANPWVAAISFKVRRGNIDALAAPVPERELVDA